MVVEPTSPSILSSIDHTAHKHRGQAYELQLARALDADGPVAHDGWCHLHDASERLTGDPSFLMLAVLLDHRLPSSLPAGPLELQHASSLIRRRHCLLAGFLPSRPFLHHVES